MVKIFFCWCFFCSAIKWNLRLLCIKGRDLRDLYGCLCMYSYCIWKITFKVSRPHMYIKFNMWVYFNLNSRIRNHKIVWKSYGNNNLNCAKIVTVDGLKFWHKFYCVVLAVLAAALARKSLFIFLFEKKNPSTEILFSNKKGHF